MNLEPRLQLDFDTAWQAYLDDPIDLAPSTRGDAASVQSIPDLLAVADHFDAMLLDGFGVLNCGDAAVPGMSAMCEALRARGVRLLVLSNGATGQTADALQKYRDLGFDFDAADILTSRDATREGLISHHTKHPDWLWGVSPMAGRSLADLPGQFLPLEPKRDWASVDGFLLVTTLAWTDEHSVALEKALVQSPRPVWVANPDVTAPFRDHCSLEPGYVARSVRSLSAVDIRWFGKPHAAVYTLALERLRQSQPGLLAERVLMVGDSPHTDLLGARSNGLKSCLTVEFGLLRGQDLNARLTECGIWPDYVMSSVPG